MYFPRREILLQQCSGGSIFLGWETGTNAAGRPMQAWSRGSRRAYGTGTTVVGGPLKASTGGSVRVGWGGMGYIHMRRGRSEWCILHWTLCPTVRHIVVRVVIVVCCYRTIGHLWRRRNIVSIVSPYPSWLIGDWYTQIRILLLTSLTVICTAHTLVARSRGRDLFMTYQQDASLDVGSVW